MTTPPLHIGLPVDDEGRLFRIALLGAVDQGMQRLRFRRPRSRITAAALPVKAANSNVRHQSLGDMPRQRGLACAGIAEQPENGSRAFAAGRLVPIGDRLKRAILFG